jgi:hypothetical protein
VGLTHRVEDCVLVELDGNSTSARSGIDSMAHVAVFLSWAAQSILSVRIRGGDAT